MELSSVTFSSYRPSTRVVPTHDLVKTKITKENTVEKAPERRTVEDFNSLLMFYSR